MAAIVDFVVFKTADGEIIRAGSLPSDQLATQPDVGEDVLQGTGATDTHYIVNPATTPVLTAKTALSVAWTQTTIDGDLIDSAVGTFTAVAALFTVEDKNGEDGTIGGVVAQYEVAFSDGNMTITSDCTSTTLVVKVEAIPHLDYTQDIVVNP